MVLTDVEATCCIVTQQVAFKPVAVLLSQVVVLFVGMSMACPCEGSGFLLVWMEVVAWLFAAGRIDLPSGDGVGAGRG